MYCARAKVSMMTIGAPQWRHTKVGRTEPVAVWASLGLEGTSAE
jgi:hypothetical protein